jgi:hypothetical protein
MPEESTLPPTPFLTYKYIYWWHTYSKRQQDTTHYDERGLEIWRSCTAAFEDHAASLNGEQLRLLRNTIYAMRGYVFTDARIQDYFKEQYWYFPNPNIRQEDIALDGIMADILRRIIAAERGE